MPATTFMGVDRRHDHSFRIPRPDLSVRMGTPNACNQCHSKKSAKWAATQIRDWYGKQPKGIQQFAPALLAARQQQPTAFDLLMKLALDKNEPVIARATAVTYFPGAASQQSLMLIQQALNATDPLLRLGALSALESSPLAQHILAFPLVWDDIRAIRIKAARLMVSFPRDKFKLGQGEVLDKAIEEYIQVQTLNAERPEAQLNLAGLYTDMGKDNKAEAAFRKAISLQPGFIPAYVNFAQMLSQRGRETEATDLLQKGLAQVPDSADLYHALGLSWVRRKQTSKAVHFLARAAELDTGNRRYQYVYAVALQSVERTAEAIDVLQKTLEKHPSDTQLLYTLVSFNQQAGNKKQALSYARKLQFLHPGNAQIEALVKNLGQH